MEPDLQRELNALRPDLLRFARLRLHVWICAGCANYRRQMDVLRAACQRFGSGGTL